MAQRQAKPRRHRATPASGPSRASGRCSNNTANRLTRSSWSASSGTPERRPRGSSSGWSTAARWPNAARPVSSQAAAEARRSRSAAERHLRATPAAEQVVSLVAAPEARRKIAQYLDDLAREEGTTQAAGALRFIADNITDQELATPSQFQGLPARLAVVPPGMEKYRYGDVVANFLREVAERSAHFPERRGRDPPRGAGRRTHAPAGGRGPDSAGVPAARGSSDRALRARRAGASCAVAGRFLGRCSRGDSAPACPRRDRRQGRRLRVRRAEGAEHPAAQRVPAPARLWQGGAGTRGPARGGAQAGWPQGERADALRRGAPERFAILYGAPDEAKKLAAEYAFGAAEAAPTSVGAWQRAYSGERQGPRGRFSEAPAGAGRAWLEAAAMRAKALAAVESSASRSPNVLSA